MHLVLGSADHCWYVGVCVCFIIQGGAGGTPRDTKAWLQQAPSRCEWGQPRRWWYCHKEAASTEYSV